jgi:hypothetical protein
MSHKPGQIPTNTAAQLALRIAIVALFVAVAALAQGMT